MSLSASSRRLDELAISPIIGSIRWARSNSNAVSLLLLAVFRWVKTRLKRHLCRYEHVINSVSSLQTLAVPDSITANAALSCLFLGQRPWTQDTSAFVCSSVQEFAMWLYPQRTNFRFRAASFCGLLMVQSFWISLYKSPKSRSAQTSNSASINEASDSSSVRSSTRAAVDLCRRTIQSRLFIHV